MNVNYYNEIMFNVNLLQQYLRKPRKQVLSIQRPEFESKVKEKGEQNNIIDVHDNSRGSHVENPKER